MFYEKICSFDGFSIFKMGKNGQKLIKISQNCTIWTNRVECFAVNSTKCIYKNLPKTIDFGGKLCYNNSA